MKKRIELIVFCLAGIVFWGLCSRAGTPLLIGRENDKTPDLRREIQVLNLLNGIELTADQMRVIRDKAVESQRLKEQWESVPVSREREIEATLEEIRSYLKEKKELPPELAQHFHQLQTEIKKAASAFEDARKNLAREVETCLESHQLHQLLEFVPCIIPPKGELRIGQAQDFRGLSRNLERIRQLPSRLYQMRKQQILWSTMERMKMLFPPGAELDEDEVMGHIADVFDKARKLDEAEFEIEKKKLAEELISVVKPLSRLDNLTHKIQAFLLSPAIIPILEERISITSK